VVSEKKKMAKWRVLVEEKEKVKGGERERERKREVFGIFCGMCWQWKE